MKNKSTVSPLKNLLERYPTVFTVGGLAVLTLIMFADVIFTSKQIVLSERLTDLHLQFVYWRDFGFSQIRQGNLPLWNPHLYCGTFYLGGFQSALFYPINLIFVLLPIDKAVNLSIAVNVFLGGLFMYLWTANRKLHPLACFVSAALFMFCGPHFMHIYAGHLPNLCTMIWVPLLLLAIDGFFEKRSIRSCLLGAFAIAMMVFAGHPQYVFYTAVVCAFYCLLCLIKTHNRLQAILGLASMCIGAVLLSAIQLFTGLDAASESLRSKSLSPKFVSMFSFPPENLITFFAPYFFGGIKDALYWGQCNNWEMSVFVGICGFILAVYGACCGKKNLRRFSVLMVFVCFIFALGAHTPLLKILYYWVPGFNKFRGMSKFILQMDIFIIMLAAIGFDRMLEAKKINRAFIFPTLLLACLCVFAGILIFRSASSGDPDGFWARVMSIAQNAKEKGLIGITFTDRKFAWPAAQFAAKGLFVSAAVLFLASVLLFLKKSANWPAYLFAFVAVCEIFFSASFSKTTFPLDAAAVPNLKYFISTHPGDYRIIGGYFFNSAMKFGWYDIWGYDPGIMRRYAQFVAFTQNQNPDTVTQFITFENFGSLLSMLRCRYVFNAENDDIKDYQELKNPLSHFELVGSYKVFSTRNEVFAAMSKPYFDPRRTVILEKNPDIVLSVPDPQGTVKLVDSSTDHMTIQAELQHPAILLITDTYSKNWCISPLGATTQAHYEILPADYTLMAVPLSAGHHNFKIEYLPAAFQIGKWVSITSATIFVAIFAFTSGRTKKPIEQTIT